MVDTAGVERKQKISNSCDVDREENIEVAYGGRRKI